MRDFLALLVSPHLIDFVLIFTFLEAMALAWLGPRLSGGRATGRSMATIGAMLLPGVFLLLATRAALAAAPWPWVPAFLAAALVAHVVDLRFRWRG